MTFEQLNADQLNELAGDYLCQHYHEYNPDAAELEAPSWGELADALDIVGRETLANEYADTIFSPDDFSCSYTPPKTRRHRDTYEIRQVDAYLYDDCWTYNTTYELGTFTTAAADVPRAFRRALAALGVSFHRGRTATEYDGDLFEIVDRKTREPLFVAVPLEV